MSQQNKVSNSYLSKFKSWLRGDDIEKESSGYLIGNIFDAIYTDTNKVNLLTNEYYNNDETILFTNEDSKRIMAMCRSLDKYIDNIQGMKHLFYKSIKQAKFEKEYLFTDGIIDSKIILTSRYDLIVPSKIGFDIKTTQAKTLKQFKDACMYFDYDRARYIYAHTSNTKKDYILGVQSNDPYNIYLINSENENYYKSGKEKLDSLLIKLFYYIL